jgi:hypothetical protein
MLNLADIDAVVLLARGQYATVRAAHEDAKKDLQMLCGQLSSVASQVLRKMQPGEDEIPDSVASLIQAGRRTLDMMEETTSRIESLAKQRSELKKEAWSK